jgi:hypothetical protein
MRAVTTASGHIPQPLLSFCIPFLRRLLHIVVEGRDGEPARASVEEHRGRSSGWRKEPA